MEDNYIHFKIDGRDLKIHKDNPEYIFMWKTHNGGYKMKNPRWNHLKIKTNENGYKQITITPKQYLLHRVNYYAWNQEWNIHDSSKNNQIDHKKDKGNLPKNQYNNIENLRVVTSQQNHFNINCKGYYWDKKTQKWQAQIRVRGKNKHLGRFNTEDEARQAYLDAKKIYHKIE
jgi:hypothetical protein